MDETTETAEMELFDTDVQEVHLVGSPANRRRWAIYKSVDGLDIDKDGGDTMADEVQQEVEEEEIQPDATDETTEAAPQEEAPAVTPEELHKAEEQNEVLKGEIAALKKDLRKVEWLRKEEARLADMGLDVEMVWKAEQMDAEVAKYFIGKLDEANKRITGLMKELGTAAPQAEPSGFVEKAKAIAKEDGITEAAAFERLGKQEPELFAEYQRQRQNAGR